MNAEQAIPTWVIRGTVIVSALRLAFMLWLLVNVWLNAHWAVALLVGMLMGILEVIGQFTVRLMGHVAQLKARATEIEAHRALQQEQILTLIRILNTLVTISREASHASQSHAHR